MQIVLITVCKRVLVYQEQEGPLQAQGPPGARHRAGLPAPRYQSYPPRPRTTPPCATNRYRMITGLFKPRCPFLSCQARSHGALSPCYVLHPDCSITLRWGSLASICLALLHTLCFIVVDGLAPLEPTVT